MRKIIYNSEAVIGDIKSERGKDETDIKIFEGVQKECICAPLFKLLEASFELIVPLVMAAIIDNGITASDKPYIWKMGGVLVLLAAVGLVSSVTAQYFAAKAAVGFPQSFAIYCLKR